MKIPNSTIFKDINQRMESPFIFNAPRFETSGAVGGWVELARTTLGSASDNIEISSIPDKRYYMILKHIKGSGAVTDRFTFNNDTATNYAWRKSNNGGTDATASTASRIITQTGTDLDNSFRVQYVVNFSSKEKLLMSNHCNATTTGAGTAPDRDEGIGKWTNTSDVISTMDMTNDQSGSFGVDSEMVLLGWDPADTHTDNFWEELASTSSSGGNLSSGTITAKKYLWVQIYVAGRSASTGDLITFNNDATTYSRRSSKNGASDVTSVSAASINPTVGGFTTSAFHSFFIINISANEKLVIGHTLAQSVAGAGTVPARSEWVGKHDNTSSQITEIDMDTGSGTYDSGTIMKVWGSD